MEDIVDLLRYGVVKSIEENQSLREMAAREIESLRNKLEEMEKSNG